MSETLPAGNINYEAIEKFITSLDNRLKATTINLGTKNNPEHIRVFEISGYLNKYSANPKEKKARLELIYKKIKDDVNLAALKELIGPMIGVKNRVSKERKELVTEKISPQKFTTPYIQMQGGNGEPLSSSIGESLPLIRSFERALLQTGVKAVEQFSQGSLQEQFELVYPSSVKFQGDRELGTMLVETTLSLRRGLESIRFIPPNNPAEDTELDSRELDQIGANLVDQFNEGNLRRSKLIAEYKQYLNKRLNEVGESSESVRVQSAINDLIKEGNLQRSEFVLAYNKYLDRRLNEVDERSEPIGVQSVVNVIKAKAKIRKGRGLPSVVADDSSPLKISSLFQNSTKLTDDQVAISRAEVEYLQEIKKVRQYRQIMRNIPFYLSIGGLKDELSQSICDSIIDLLKDKSPSLRLSILKRAPSLQELPSIIAQNPLTFDDLDYIRNKVLRETAYIKEIDGKKYLVIFDLHAKKLTQLEFDDPSDALNRTIYARTIEKAFGSDKPGFIIVEASQTQKGDNALEENLDYDDPSEADTTDDLFNEIINEYGDSFGVPALNTTLSSDSRSASGSRSDTKVIVEERDRSKSTNMLIELKDGDDELSAEELIEYYLEVGKPEKPKNKAPEVVEPLPPQDQHSQDVVVDVSDALDAATDLVEKENDEELEQEFKTIEPKIDYLGNWLLDRENVESFRDIDVLNKIKQASINLTATSDEDTHSDINDLKNILTNPDVSDKDFFELYLLNFSNLITLLQTKSSTSWFIDIFSNLDISGFQIILQKILDGNASQQDLIEFKDLHTSILSLLKDIPQPFSLSKDTIINPKNIKKISDALTNRRDSKEIEKLLHKSINRVIYIKRRDLKNLDEVTRFNGLMDQVFFCSGFSTSNLKIETKNGVSPKNTVQMISRDEFEGLGRLDVVIELFEQVYLVAESRQLALVKLEKSKAEAEVIPVPNTKQRPEEIVWGKEQILAEIDRIYNNFVSEYPDLQNTIDTINSQYTILKKLINLSPDSPVVAMAYQHLQNHSDGQNLEGFHQILASQDLEILTTLWDQSDKQSNMSTLYRIFNGKGKTNEHARDLLSIDVEAAGSLHALFSANSSEASPEEISELRDEFLSQVDNPQELLNVLQIGGAMTLLESLQTVQKKQAEATEAEAIETPDYEKLITGLEVLEGQIKNLSAEDVNPDFVSAITLTWEKFGAEDAKSKNELFAARMNFLIKMTWHVLKLSEKSQITKEGWSRTVTQVGRRIGLHKSRLSDKIPFIWSADKTDGNDYEDESFPLQLENIKKLLAALITEFKSRAIDNDQEE